MKPILLSVLASALLAAASHGQPPAALKIHLIGVGEYEAAKSMAEFKKHLEQTYRVECTASLGGNSKTLDNLDALKSADLLLIFARRLNLPDEQMMILRQHWEKGKPIVAMRTSSHAFQPADNEIFDKKVLGGDYKGSGSYTTPFKAITVKGQAEHPVLKKVGPITSRGYYGNGKLAEDALVLQIVDSERKTPQPVTWTHTYKGGRTVYTSMGTPEDFQNEDFRQLLVNAIFWTTRREPETRAIRSKTATGPAIGTQGMISSAHPLATQAGLEILEAGGNAFDAAVAVSATLNVVEPMMSGMGGFGVALIHDADKGVTRCLDASGRFPAATDADVLRASTPNYLDNRKGAKSVSTPGNVNAWETLAKEHGKLSWPRLLAPAIKLADDGFIISAHTARHIQSEFPVFPEHAKTYYGNNSKPLQAGDRLVQKDLARSLRLLAAQGAKAIHGGELGEAIDKEMRRAGGFLTLDDLKKNRAEWWDPISIDYRGHKVVASPLPNNAWNGLLRLGIMSRFDLAKMGHNSPAYLHTFAEATKLAYQARLQYAGDRDSPPPFDRLLSEKHWALEAARIKPDKALLPFPSGRGAGGEGEYTTHFVIADAQGNVVTSTQTLGMLFGSKVMAPGTGIWLNNSMQYCTFEPKGNPLDALPGRRKLAGFCPMLVLRDGKPWLALGSPGGHTIVQTVPQLVMNLIDFKMDVQQAIAVPRLSFVDPNITAVDEGVPENVRKQLSALGHNVQVRRLGNAHGLTIEYDTKGRPQRFTGGADPRGEGAAMGR